MGDKWHSVGVESRGKLAAKCLNFSNWTPKNKCIEGAVKAVERAATNKEGGGEWTAGWLRWKLVANVLLPCEMYL